MHMTKINEWMRSKAKVFLAVICALIMVAWFILPAIGRVMETDRVPDAKVFGTSIDGEKVLSMARGLAFMQRAQQMERGSNWDALLGQAYYLTILQEEARRQGITISDERVTEEITQVNNGVGGRLDEMLREMSTPSMALRDAMRARLAAAELFQTVGDAVTMSDEEAWLWYSQEAQKVKADFIQLRAAQFAPLMKVDEEKLKEYFTRHAQYTAPEDGPHYLRPMMAKVEYVLAPYKNYEEKAKANVTDDQVKAYYEKNKEKQFRKSPAEIDKESLSKDAAGAKDAAEPKKEGENKDAAAEAKPAEAKKAVDPFKPLDQVAAQIREDLVRQENEKLAEAALRDVRAEAVDLSDAETMRREGFDPILKPLAGKAGLEHHVTDLFSEADASVQIPGAMTLPARVFGSRDLRQTPLKPGQPSTVESASAGKYFLRILTTEEPRPYQLDEKGTRERVEKDFRQYLAMNAAQEVLDEAVKKDTMDAAAEVVNARVAELIKNATLAADAPKEPKDYVTRNETDFFGQAQRVPRQYAMNGMQYVVGPIKGLSDTYNFNTYGPFVDAVFEAKPEKMQVVRDASVNSIFLVKRTGTQPADPAEYAKMKEQVKDRALSQKQQLVYAQWMEDLKRRANPTGKMMEYLGKLPGWDDSSPKAKS